jgi:hypothetical protein
MKSYYNKYKNKRKKKSWTILAKIICTQLKTKMVFIILLIPLARNSKENIKTKSININKKKLCTVITKTQKLGNNSLKE